MVDRVNRYRAVAIDVCVDQALRVAVVNFLPVVFIKIIVISQLFYIILRYNCWPTYFEYLSYQCMSEWWIVSIGTGR